MSRKNRLGTGAVAVCAVMLAACAAPAGQTPAVSLPPEPAVSAPARPEPLPVREDLLPVETYSDPREEAVTHIVLHFMSAVAVRPEAPYDREAIRTIFLEGGVSTHYVIDREGGVWRLIPEDRVAWHAGVGTWEGEERYTNKLNLYAVGIELLGIGTEEEMSGILTPEEYRRIDPALLGFTDAQYRSLSRLVTEIRGRHPGITADRRHILGHDEYSPRKTDPGSLFDWGRLGLASS